MILGGGGGKGGGGPPRARRIAPGLPSAAPGRYGRHPFTKVALLRAACADVAVRPQPPPHPDAESSWIARKVPIGVIPAPGRLSPLIAARRARAPPRMRSTVMTAKALARGAAHAGTAPQRCAVSRPHLYEVPVSVASDS